MSDASPCIACGDMVEPGTLAPTRLPDGRRVHAGICALSHIMALESGRDDERDALRARVAELFDQRDELAAAAIRVLEEMDGVIDPAEPDGFALLRRALARVRVEDAT